ncbi:MAG: hypothetical protein A2580_09075 [Hydrogenophilales bacterium RIFOXYD1_FULL_62_11]|nr:MAG: hypothetical protein A2580_09075 [Hydrogenophilales bacterium RIFOXYD1_FULL_62_11]
MTPGSSAIYETGAAALVFAATFLVGGRVHPFRSLIRDRRSILSFGAGMSAAYVFVHVMPELHDARRAFVESIFTALRYEGMAIYFIALLGFLLFYGLEHQSNRLRGSGAEGATGPAFKLDISGFAAYVWLMAYLLVNHFGNSLVSIELYAIALTFHFLSLDHSLRHEHGDAYERVGRFVLAGMALLGWGMGQLFALPGHILALLVAFISGAIIVNALIMELPAGKDGRFLPFMAGGLVYGLILLPLG